MEIEMGATRFRALNELFAPGRNRKHDLVVAFDGDVAKVVSYLGEVVFVCRIFASNLEKVFRILVPHWADGYKSKYYTCNRVEGTSRCMSRVRRNNCPKGKGIPCRCRNFLSVQYR